MHRLSVREILIQNKVELSIPNKTNSEMRSLTVQKTGFSGETQQVNVKKALRYFTFKLALHISELF